MSHTKEELLQMQSLPLETKIKMSQQRILEWYEKFDGAVYVSFSGGKDSTVLKHLVENTPGIRERERERESTVPSVFCDTGLEYPEVRRFAISQPNVTVIKPKMRFDEVIQKYGWPIIYKEAATYIYEIRHTKSEKLREKRLNGEPNASGGRSGRLPNKYRYLLDAPFEISAKCCHVMKKQSMARYERETGRKPYTGMMAEESSLRRQLWLKYGCNAFGQKSHPQSHPIMFWTEQDILKYLQVYQLPYASVYGDIIETENGLALTGLSRTGCMFCGFGCHLEPEPNRFQRMKETHPAQYKYCMDKLGLREVLDYINVPYE